MGFDKYSALYDKLVESRIIFLGEAVDDDIANYICAQLLFLSSEDPKTDISMYINSPGGSVTSGLAIYDIMQYIPNDIRTVGLGLAASMGQLLLCAGTKNKRYAMPNTEIMMHQVSAGIGGTASDIKIQAKQLLHTKNRLIDIIALHTGRTNKEVVVDSDRDRWFTAYEAREYGIIDDVITKMKI